MTTEAVAAEPVVEHASMRRAATLTALTGAAHALLFLLAIVLITGVPGPKASDADLVAFYSGESTRRLVVVGLYVMPFAGIAFLWFVVALRMWLRVRSDRMDNVALFSNVQLVSGIVFIALFLAGAAASSTMAASVQFTDAPVDPALARQMPEFGNTLMFVFAMRMAAIFIISTSTIGRLTGALPKWFIVAGYLVGLVLLLSATFSPLLILAFPVWMLLLSLQLLLRARRIPADATVPVLRAP